MAYGVSNSHVTHDVTWPWKVKLVTAICLERISRKRLEIETPCRRTTNRKRRMGCQMVSWLMTSLGPQRCCEAVRSAVLATAGFLFYLPAWQCISTPRLQGNQSSRMRDILHLFYCTYDLHHLPNYRSELVLLTKTLGEHSSEYAAIWQTLCVTSTIWSSVWWMPGMAWDKASSRTQLMSGPDVSCACIQ